MPTDLEQQVQRLAAVMRDLTPPIEADEIINVTTHTNHDHHVMTVAPEWSGGPQCTGRTMTVVGASARTRRRSEPAIGRVLEQRSGTRRLRLLVGVAAAVAVVAICAAGLVATSRHPSVTGATPASNTTTSNTTTSNTSPEVSLPISGSGPCDVDGCSGFNPLPVAPGATDYYAGGLDLGEPHVSTSYFNALTRCAELSADFTSCQRIEGIAGVNLVSYPIAADTNDGAAGEIGIGTTFTALAPSAYATAWGPTKGTGTQEPATVRGHDAVRYMNETSPAVVWEERPGVLAWVTVPPGMADRLLSIAEGVRRIDGPPTIPHRVQIPTLSTPWDAHDNDGRGLIVARYRADECVGLDYVNGCGQDMTSRTIIRQSPYGTNVITGSTPANVTTVVVEVDSELERIETNTFANYTSRFYRATLQPGILRAVLWLDANGNIVASSTPIITINQVDATASGAVEHVTAPAEPRTNKNLPGSTTTP